VRDRQHLRQVARHDKAGSTGRGFGADDFVDLVLGADVDALGWLVEEEYAGIDAKPARQHDFLLIAAAQVVWRRLDPGRLDMPGAKELVAECPFLRRANENRSTGNGTRQDEIVTQREVEEERLTLTILRHEGDPRARGLEDAAAREPCLTNRYVSSARAVEAEDRLEQFRPARSHKTKYPEDFSSTDFETDVVDHWRARQATDAQYCW
jgi:hypothetical protein